MSRLSHVSTFDSWIRFKDYRFLWIGNAFANSTQWLQLLTVGWLVRDLTATSAYSGLLVVTVGGLSTLPTLVFGPLGGVLGDRLDRKKLVMAVHIIMAVVALLFALLVHSGRVEWWHAYAYVLIGGSCWSITMPLRWALIANTVPRESIVNAYAANVITITGSRILGPLLGGVLITTLGFFWNFTVEALLYLGTVLALLPMRTPYYEGRGSVTTGSPFSNLKEGLRYIWHGERLIFQVIVLGLIPNTILHPVWFLLPIFTVNVLHHEADVGGYLLATTGVGGLAAALIIASSGFVFKRGFILLGTMLLSSVSVILFAQSHWLFAAILMIGLFGFAQTTFRTTAGTLVQLLVPDGLRGRVTSLEQYSQGFLILSSLLIGWFVDLTTVTIALLTVGGVGLTLAIFAAGVSQRVRQLV